MSASPNGEDHRHQKMERYLVFIVVALSALCLFSVVFVETASLRQRSEFVPISLNSKEIALYSSDPLTIQIPGVRLDLIEDAIRDQEPDADAAARFAIVQANLLTPVAWLVTPTPSRTPTPTRTSTLTATPTPTAAPTDPWVLLGYARVGCNTEVSFDPVAARKFKIQLISGGGNDDHISFYCCGSSGVAFWANNTWVPVTEQSSALNVGESRETGDVNAIVNRARFNIGCNDKEQAQGQVFYIPAATPSPTTPTATSLLTRVSTSTRSPTLTTQTATRSVAPSATFVPQTPTVSPTIRSR
jgi:hypothetical protein